MKTSISESKGLTGLLLSLLACLLTACQGGEPRLSVQERTQQDKVLGLPSASETKEGVQPSQCPDISGQYEFYGNAIVPNIHSRDRDTPRITSHLVFGWRSIPRKKYYGSRVMIDWQNPTTLRFWLVDKDNDIEGPNVYSSVCQDGQWFVHWNSGTFSAGPGFWRGTNDKLSYMTLTKDGDLVIRTIFTLKGTSYGIISSESREDFTSRFARVR